MMKCVDVLCGGDILAEGKGKAGPNEGILGVVMLVGGLVWGRFKVSSKVAMQQASAPSVSTTAGSSVGGGQKRAPVRLPGDLKLQGSPGVAKKQKRRPETAPVIASVYKYTDEAADFLPSLNPGQALYQVIFTHDAYPSICYNTLQMFGRFMERTAEDGNPGNYAALRRAGVILVLTKPLDPDRVGYVANRMAFYVAGDVNNFLHLFEEFLVFLTKEKDLHGSDAFPSGLSLSVEPHADVDLAMYRDAEKTLAEVNVNEVSNTLTHHVFSVNPPNGLWWRSKLSVT